MNTTAEQKRLFDDPVADAEPVWYWCDNYEGRCDYRVKTAPIIDETPCPKCGKGKLELEPF